MAKTTKATAANNAAADPYRILSLDGGGLRGVITLVIIEQLDTAVPNWRDKINMFAGTSTGALIALALASGMPPSKILDVYMRRGAFIFDRSLIREVVEGNDLLGAKYSGDHREQVCKEILGDLRLRDLRSADQKRGHVVISSFDLNDRAAASEVDRRWKAKVFHNLPSPDADDNEYAYRVAMRSSAAPTYFPSYDGLVDGGVFANNPSMCALAQTQDRRLQHSIPFDSVMMLSIGTGVHYTHLDGDNDWGVIRWAPHLVDLLTDGVNEVADFQCKQLMSIDRYFRISPRLQFDIAMDDASKLALLQRIGAAVDISDAVTFMKNW